MEERHLAVNRTARYYALGDGPVTEAWVVCHGYGQLAGDFLKTLAPLARPGRLVVAPEALSRFYVDPLSRGGSHRQPGASWMTRADREHEIDDYVRWLDSAYADALVRAGTPRPERLVVLGFSQGAATAARWAAGSAMLPAYRCDRLILWGGTLPEDLDLSASRDWLSRRLTLVAGRDDPWATPARLAAEDDRLRANGIAFERVAFDGGHVIDGATLARLAVTRSERF